LLILEKQPAGSSYQARVFHSDGSGAFSLVGAYTASLTADTNPIYGAIGLSDVTGDGKLDAVVSARSLTVRILPGNGDGTFGSPTSLAGGGIGGSRDVTFADLDGDGKLDMASVGDLLGNPDNTGAAAFFHANGGGSYQAWDGYGAGISPSGIAVGDLDLDGLPDLVVSNEGSNSVSVLLHTSTPSVAVQTPPITTHFALSATPNPASGPWSVSFSLPGSGPAHLEVIDLAGRIVAKREVGHFGAGTHVLALPETGSLPTGVYFLRLTRGTQTQVAKVCAIR
jgi:VCBS repeat protein/FG-GAP repeat protein